ncbi:chloride channel CLIC-like protein 1 [Thalassophryne amazonica]|uniref:chloride channel CLIC-like protein 1 n=1 Tax=Thalassophryne amazonica TaxID=390379 RepID=UPI001470EBD9|nr:chloride channel CLIC-like protein 1 [Thalassophryne amazonica]XP_034035809.1 chloride channel CLIC-like protein 1 [Thalassophryne amazonica]
MLLFVLICCLVLVHGEHGEEDWLDPYDMLNYDPSTKTMRSPAETPSAPNAPTKRREHVPGSCHAEIMACSKNVEGLQQQISDLKKNIASLSQQPMYSPVFKRFLHRLLNEMERVGLPSKSNNILYDAKVSLSSQAVTDIQKFLEGEDSWRTGALDSAISQILVDFRPHNYEAWKWHFEDTFGVELDTLLKIGLFGMIISIIIATQWWSSVSWFAQLRRLFYISFFTSFVWNWFYLYQTAFAEHQNNIVKMDSVTDKCRGMKKIDWSDSLKEWFRSTWTLQDDPCKKYFEVLVVNPILLVPPTKAISLTITTFITEPLKHFGQGISEFLRALLKDLPITLQIPVLITIVLSILVFMYGSVQAAFRYGITAPLRRRIRSPTPPQLEQQQPPLHRIQDVNHLTGASTPSCTTIPGASDSRPHRSQVRQRQPSSPRVTVETLHTASQDETDTVWHEQSPETDQSENLTATDSDHQTETDSDNPEDTEEELPKAIMSVPLQPTDSETKSNTPQVKSKLFESSPNKSLLKAKCLKVNDLSHLEHSRNKGASKSRPKKKRAEIL